jgi:protein-S-isoprenylcysteine O-methyltransferase Ste14
MKAYDAMVKQGNWMFRYRSYLPLALIAFALICTWVYRDLYSLKSGFYDILCFLMALGGEAIRVTAVGYAADNTSGRNTKRQIADEINQTGIYSLTRHPLYVGNFIIWLSVAFFSRIWWVVAIFTTIYWLYYERIILAEEKFLEEKFGEQFLNYASRVSILCPRFRNYVPNRYFFRPCRVLRKENSTLYGIVVVYVIFKLFHNYLGEHLFFLQAEWIIILVLFSIAYFVLRILKSYTDVLRTEIQEEKIRHEE